MFSRMRETWCFGTHLPASSVEVGLVLRGTFVALTFNNLESAISELDKFCKLVPADSKTLGYTEICLLTECLGFSLFDSVVNPMPDACAKLDFFLASNSGCCGKGSFGASLAVLLR